MTIKEIEYQNFKYYYKIYKNDHEKIDPIFFVSGAFQNMESWKLIYTYFIPKTTVIVADLPGIGMADYLPDDYGLDFLVETIYQIIEEASLNKVYMIAASYGTALSYRFAKKYPEKLSLLTLAGTMKEFPLHLKDNIIESLRIAEKGKGHEFAGYVLKNGLMYNRMDADVKINKYEFVKRMLTRQLSYLDKPLIDKFISNTKRLLREDSIDLSDAPHVKSLVFTGEYDVLTTPALCRSFAERLNNSVFTTIKNADHLFHLEQTQTTVDLLYRFAIGCDFKGLENCNELEFFLN